MTPAEREARALIGVPGSRHLIPTPTLVVDHPASIGPLSDVAAERGSDPGVPLRSGATLNAPPTAAPCKPGGPRSTSANSETASWPGNEACFRSSAFAPAEAGLPSGYAAASLTARTPNGGDGQAPHRTLSPMRGRSVSGYQSDVTKSTA